MKPAFRRTAARVALAAGVALTAALLCSQSSPREQVGPLPGGGFLLNSGWKLDPAGKQMPARHLPDGHRAFAGRKVPARAEWRLPSAQHQRDRYRLGDGGEPARRCRTPGSGLAFTPNGDRVYVGGGSKASVFEFTFANGTLQPGRTFEVVPAAQRTARDFIGDVTLSPDGRLLYAADLYHDSLVVINPQSGMVIQRVKTGRRPYRILFHPDGKSFFVTHWADGTLGHYDAMDGSLLATVRIGAHPTDMVWRDGRPRGRGPGRARPSKARLFVAAANTNNVYAVGVTESKTLNVIESINVSMTPRQPLGMTPSALALSPDKKRLFVACSDANAAAVVDVTMERSRVEGFIPAGWYPTAVRVLPSGTLVVLNGKGLALLSESGRAESFEASGGSSQRAGHPARLCGLHADRHRLVDRAVHVRSTGGLDQGRAGQFALPRCQARRDHRSCPPQIQHVIYIVRENRTYDQVLGDMKEGNGDPSLVLFGEKVTPNPHKLAREFVLLDNFYVNADVSADGHNWSTAAIAPDYVQKLWPNQYAGRRKLYDFEEQDPTSLPPAGYLWTNAVVGRVIDPQFRLHGEQQAGRGCREASRSQAFATRSWPRSPTGSIADSTWTIRTWSAPGRSSTSWRNTKRPAICRA